MTRFLRRFATSLAVSLIMVTHAAAQEVVVRNDSYSLGGPLVAVGDFVPGERAASWLTSPCDGRIVAVQILWASAFGGQPPSIENNITIAAAGTFPNPGAPLLEIVGPQLIDGFINEFRFSGENQTNPIRVPVQQGQTFVVWLQFDNPTNVGGGSPSVVRDVDNIQPNRNGIFARLSPGVFVWFNSQTLGVAGDFVIRAVVNCQAPDPPFNPLPASGSAGVDRLPTLSWECEIARTYDVFLWPAGDPQPSEPIASGLAIPTYTVTEELDPDRFYAWRIIARNNSGATTGPIWQFRTAKEPVPVLPEVWSLY